MEPAGDQQLQVGSIELCHLTSGFECLTSGVGWPSVSHYSGTCRTSSLPWISARSRGQDWPLVSFKPLCIITLFGFEFIHNLVFADVIEFAMWLVLLLFHVVLFNKFQKLAGETKSIEQEFEVGCSTCYLFSIICT